MSCSFLYHFHWFYSITTNMIFPDCVAAICWQELRQPLTFSNWKCQAWVMSQFFFPRIFSNNYFCLFFRKSSHSEWETFLHFILKNSFSSANIAETDFELLSNIKTRKPVRLQFKIWTQNNEFNILMISSNSFPKRSIKFLLYYNISFTKSVMENPSKCIVYKQ